ncbi:MAG: KAP family NTPase [candidate division Zixibacteria bacterium]|nr:KAP family NTPase [candidate division Zixibacteria bacterium]MDH3938112.1 KAP family NTPase [candidate division Zixibacteria bacterium]MDH4034027.1 KAP family NTPase [candidate division Zixibacteria bacterium]
MNSGTRTIVKFLRETPLQSEDDFKRVRFGHKDIANTLTSIVSICETPFTIGLFGKWGSGKSSIAYLAAAALRKKGIPTVIFDVWKHEGDSLRRSFLREFVRQMKSPENDNLDAEFELDDRMNNAVTRVNDGEFKVNWTKVKQARTAFVFAVAVLVVFALAASYFDLIQVYERILGFTLGSLLGGGFLLWLVKNATQFLGTETTTFSVERLSDPHEFEDEFVRILRETHRPKCLIVFDNLDRVSHELALKSLSTIKTFLEPKDIEVEEKSVVFLIPCDDSAIREHIRAVYVAQAANNSKSTYSPDEFQKKFFNTVVRIPDFYPTELESFTVSCLEETGLKDLSDSGIAWMITYAYRDNPRQVIQFVNILLSHYMLIQEREGQERDFELGYAKRNRREICLFLLLQHRHPDLMAELTSRGIGALEDIPDDLGRKELNEDLESLRSLAKDVSSVAKITNLRPYTALRQSDQERHFPGLDRLYVLCEDNKISDAIKAAEDIPQIKENHLDFVRAVQAEFGSKRNPITAAYFLNSVLHVLEALNIKVDSTRCSAVYSAMDSRLRKRIEIIAPGLLRRTLLQVCPHLAPALGEMWMDRIEDILGDDHLKKKSGAFVRVALEEMADNETLTVGFEGRIKSSLTAHFSGDIEVARQFTQTGEQQQKYLDAKYVSDFTRSISETDILLLENEDSDKPLCPSRLYILGKFLDNLLPVSVLSLAVPKITLLMDTLREGGWESEHSTRWKALIRGVLEFVVSHETISHDDVPEIDELSDAAINTFSAIPGAEQCIAVPLMELLLDRASESTADRLQEHLNEFYAEANLGGLKYVIDLVDDREGFVTVSRNAATLKDRAMSDPLIFAYFYSHLSTGRRSDWLVEWLTYDTKLALEFVRKRGYRIPQKDRFLRAVLELAGQSDITMRSGCYEVLNATKCNNNLQLVEQYITQVIELIRDVDSSSQEAAFKAIQGMGFLDRLQKREITKAAFVWVIGLPPNERLQLSTLRCIEFWSPHLTTDEADQLVPLCFDDLVIKSHQTDTIDLGFGILVKASPSYLDKDRKLNYDDLKRAYEEESDVLIKQAIARGLNRLKPSKPQRGEKTYWAWVDSLPLE